MSTAAIVASTIVALFVIKYFGRKLRKLKWYASVGGFVHLQCRLLAPNGHAAAIASCLLLGD